jgi:hypothetical protein
MPILGVAYVSSLALCALIRSDGCHEVKSVDYVAEGQKAGLPACMPICTAMYGQLERTAPRHS